MRKGKRTKYGKTERTHDDRMSLYWYWRYNNHPSCDKLAEIFTVSKHTASHDISYGLKFEQKIEDEAEEQKEKPTPIEEYDLPLEP